MYIHLFLFCKIDFKKWGCWIKTYMHFEASYFWRTITDFIIVVIYSFDYWIDVNIEKKSKLVFQPYIISNFLNSYIKSIKLCLLNR